MIDAEERTTTGITSDTSAESGGAPSSHDQEVLGKLVKATLPIIAEGFELYEKTKKFALITTRSQNSDGGSLFDEQAREVFVSMDALSEQIRQIGGVPARSISHVGELHGVENYGSDLLSSREMIRQLIEDNRRIAESLRNANAICRDDSQSLATTLQDALGRTEQRIQLLNIAADLPSAQEKTT
jgi:starvation-inducible DNA-binding protein